MSNVKEWHNFDRCKLCAHFRLETVIGSDGFNHTVYRCKKLSFSGHEKDCPNFKHMEDDKR